MDWIWQKLRTSGARSWHNNTNIHKKALKKDENKLRLGISVFLYMLLSWAIIQDYIKLGLSFIFAGATAIYAGYIYKGRQTMGLVLVGVALASMLIPTFFPAIEQSFKQGDYVGVLILILPDRAIKRSAEICYAREQKREYNISLL